MADEINYLDLIVLRKMDAESSVEKFGSTINTSFFETANLLGTMKIKGLLDIHSSIAGHSPLAITGEGQDFLAMAMQKASEPLDALDRAALSAIGAGMRDLNSLQNALSIRGRDLAMHLHKLKMQDYIDHEVRSGRVFLSLTEKGFILAGSSTWRPPEGAGGAGGANAAGAKQATSVPATKASSVSSSVRAAADDIEDIIRGLGRGSKAAPAASSGAPIAPGSSIPAASSNAAASAQSSRGLMGISGAGSQAASPPAASSSSPSSSSYGGEIKLDRATMLLSKLEYYLKAYLPFGILLLLLLAVLVFAIFSGLAGPAMGRP